MEIVTGELSCEWRMGKLFFKKMGIGPYGRRSGTRRGLRGKSGKCLARGKSIRNESNRFENLGAIEGVKFGVVAHKLSRKASGIDKTANKNVTLMAKAEAAWKRSGLHRERRNCEN